MDFNLKENVNLTKEIMVDKEDTAIKHGSGSLEVYATPAMIGLMENTAKDCIEKDLPKGYTTVGIGINIKHIKATPVEMQVKCKAILTKIDRKKLFFNVEAWDEKAKIGEGTHVRYIVNSEDFMEKIEA